LFDSIPEVILVIHGSKGKLSPIRICLRLFLGSEPSAAIIEALATGRKYSPLDTSPLKASFPSQIAR